MPNYGYHLARAEGHAVRSAYAAGLPLIVRRAIRPVAELPFEVFAYSGENALPEQVASIRSLLKHAGRSQKFTVVSDGSYSTRSIEILRSIDPSVAVSQVADWMPQDLPEPFRAYLGGHPTGKQLAVIMSLPVNGPTLYIDSDVLFFPGATALASAVADDLPPGWYLADCGVSADERLFREASERTNPVNTGVLFLRQKFDWSIGISRFLELDGAPTFFTNQTMTHLAMHANGARAFDPRKFVLQLDDQFVYQDIHAGPELVLRHYVNPVRHKFWTTLRRESFHG